MLRAAIHRQTLHIPPDPRSLEHTPIHVHIPQTFSARPRRRIFCQTRDDSTKHRSSTINFPHSHLNSLSKSHDPTPSEEALFARISVTPPAPVATPSLSGIHLIVPSIVAATIAGGVTFSLLSLHASLLRALSALLAVAFYPISTLLTLLPPSPSPSASASSSDESSPSAPSSAPSAVRTPQNGSLVAYTKQAAPAALATMAVTFPNAMQEDTFIHALAQELANLGIKRHNCIALVNTCRDEVCRPIVKLIDREFGLSFNIGGLGGLVNCGTTGFKAAMSHSPEFPCEINGGPPCERYIFFGFPHVSVGESGQVGSLLRRGRGKPSSACGALIAIKNDISRGGPVQDDADDLEYVLLKRKIAARVCCGWSVAGASDQGSAGGNHRGHREASGAHSGPQDSRLCCHHWRADTLRLSDSRRAISIGAHM
ncbi:hypothetical protein CLOM_g16270 [Closterium sp. NIES-68]|nr:hypothetical protein CLOM_g16270 [Closterium sp. NIES-68]